MILFISLGTGKPERLSYDGKPCPKPSCTNGRQLIETEIETLDGCPYYKCLAPEESEECHKPSCPPGYIMVRLNDRAARLQANDPHARSRRYVLSEEQCPRYECVPAPNQPETTLTTHSRSLLTSPAFEQDTTESTIYDKVPTSTTTISRTTSAATKQPVKILKCSLEGTTLNTFDEVNFVFDICYAEIFTQRDQDVDIRCKY